MHLLMGMYVNMDIIHSNYGYTRRYYWQYNLVGIYNDFLTDAVSDWVNTDVYTSISIRETGNQSF